MSQEIALNVALTAKRDLLESRAGACNLVRPSLVRIRRFGMLNSLRSRLFVSYVFVILVTLCIVGAGLLVLLTDFQRGIATQRLSTALAPAAERARQGLVEGHSPNDIVNDIQDDFEASSRVLLLDDKGFVIADSQNEFVGRRLQAVQGVQNVRPRFVTGQQLIAGRSLIYAAVPIARADGSLNFLVLASVVRPFLGAIDDLLSPLLIAGAIALVIAIVLAVVLARSISGPLGELTRATEAIARGNYQESVPIRSDDEVGRLGASFNTMTHAVQHSQQIQKDFVANVSHELKTPLTSIQGFAQAISEGATRDLESAQRAGKLIYEESQRMARLVGELLTLARLDAGDVPMERARLDLAAMLPAWVERFQGRAADAGVQLSLVMDSPPPVVGDAGRLEQVVANLIDNGIKYNHVGGRVDVKAAREMTGGAGGLRLRDSDRTAAPTAQEWAVIRVSDTGSGIPKSSQPRLFERFFRADRARTTGGSGLGLAIVEEIVKAHRGYVQVQSEEGTGTTFSVWLPASR